MTADQHALALNVLEHDNEVFRQVTTVAEAETIQAALLAYRKTLAAVSFEVRRLTGILAKLRLHKGLLGPFTVTPFDSSKKPR